MFTSRRARKNVISQPTDTGAGVPMAADAATNKLDTASRVLALAQQTADQAIADAQQKAAQIIADAQQEAEQIRARARAERDGSFAG